MKKPEIAVFNLDSSHDFVSGNGHLSRARDAKGVGKISTQTWITPPGGSTPIFGHIPLLEDRYDHERCCPAGEIRLPTGTVAFGFVHLNDPKRKGRYGQAGPVAFAHSVTSNYNEIWVQQGRGRLLLLHQDRKKAVILSRDLTDGAYVIITAFLLERGHNFKKRKEVRVWPKPGW